MAAHPKQFSYAYDQEIGYNDQPAFKLDPAIKKFAERRNCLLNSCIYFNIKTFLNNPQAVRNYYLNPNNNDPLCNGTIYEIPLDDEEGASVLVTFFDRGSKNLMVVCEGFSGAREFLIPFLAIDPYDDVLLVDFRGHRYKESSWLNPSSWKIFNPIQSWLHLDRRLESFGRNEDKDLHLAVSLFKDHNGKSYDNIFGLGVCYGAFVLFKTALYHPKLFNKIILDSCYLSMESFFENNEKNVEKQTGIAQSSCLGKILFSNTTKKIYTYLRTVMFPQLEHMEDLSLEKYRKDYKPAPGHPLSVLFLHSKNDMEVSNENFEALWNLVPPEWEKAALIHTSPHAEIHFKLKELYKLMTDLFLYLPIDQFIKCMGDINNVKQHFGEK